MTKKIDADLNFVFSCFLDWKVFSVFFFLFFSVCNDIWGANGTDVPSILYTTQIMFGLYKSDNSAKTVYSDKH